MLFVSVWAWLCNNARVEAKGHLCGVSHFLPHLCAVPCPNLCVKACVAGTFPTEPSTVPQYFVFNLHLALYFFLHFAHAVINTMFSIKIASHFS